MDFAELVPVEEGVPMEVRHPHTGEVVMHDDTPVTISLLGKDSEVYRNAIADRTRKQYRQSTRKRDVPELNWDAEGLELLLACTVGWSGVVYEGRDLPYSPANARMLYGRLRWLREQAEEFIMERENFFRGSKAT